jgi:DNA-binding transcriptional regulator LsrR (DeoR family)
MQTATRKPSDDAELIFKIAALFFSRNEAGRWMTAVEIRDRLKRDYPDLTRESIYPMLARARELNFVTLTPPVDERLADDIRLRFPGASQTEIRVVKTRGIQFNEAVSASAAKLAIEMLEGFRRAGRATVGLGLGPGQATLDFVRHLSINLEHSMAAPQMDLFAITAGCLPSRPELAPISFFNLFPATHVRKRVGLFAETLVSVREFEDIKGRIGVREAFEAKDDIDIVVTALGDAEDEHDLLSGFLRASGKDIGARGTIGNVQYRPFSIDGPVHEGSDGLRAVTLFELADLARLATQKGRYVILIARQCGLCGRHKARVLRALLERKDLRVFSHLVMDLPTAEALLVDAATDAAPSGAAPATPVTIENPKPGHRSGTAPRARPASRRRR